MAHRDERCLYLRHYESPDGKEIGSFMRLFGRAARWYGIFDYAKGNSEECDRAFATTLGFGEVEFVD